MQEQNFADEIYKLFKSRRKTSLRCNDLIEGYKKQYGRSLNTTELRELPFIQFERNGGNNNMIYLVIELDDCCNKCKFRYCKLLHSVRHDDKFQLLYQSHHSNAKHKLCNIERPNVRLIQRVKDILNESTSNPKQVTLSQMRKRHNKLYPQFKSHEPTSHGIAIRFKSTFHIGYDDAKDDHLITFKHDQNHHNLRYNSVNIQSTNTPNHTQKSNVIINTKKSHQSPWQKKGKHKTSHNRTNHKPNPLSITKESPSHPPSQLSSSSKHTPNHSHAKSNNNHNADGHVNEDTKNSSFGSIIPEQNDKNYLSISISPEWNDSKLIPDLVRHISQHTGKHIGDAYIDNRIRLGFFTAKHESIANQFIKKVRSNKTTCWGRTVHADIIPLPKNNEHHGIAIQRQQKGYRVRIQNVNCIMGRKDFENWVYAKTNVLRKKRVIYDIEIVFPKLQRGSKQCIMLFDTANDTKYVMDKIQNVQFRGFPLKFEYWKHPNYKPKSTKLVHNKKMSKPMNMNHIKNPKQIALSKNKNKIKKTSSSSKPQTNIWAKMASERKQKQKQKQLQQQQQEQIQPKQHTRTQVETQDDATDDASQQSSSSMVKSNTVSQPTKPPKKLPTPTASVPSMTPSSTPSSISAQSPAMMDNNMNKPRVPPLINSINRFRDNNDTEKTNDSVVSSPALSSTQQDTEQPKDSQPTSVASHGQAEQEPEQPNEDEEQDEGAQQVTEEPQPQPQPPTQVQPMDTLQDKVITSPNTTRIVPNAVPAAILAQTILQTSPIKTPQMQQQQQQQQQQAVMHMYAQQISQLQLQAALLAQSQPQPAQAQQIRIVPINHLQQIQQLQMNQLQAQQIHHPMQINQLPNLSINGLPNLYPAYPAVNVPNINIPQYISSMQHPPPPSSFSNLFSTTPSATPQNTNTNTTPMSLLHTLPQQPPQQQQQQQQRPPMKPHLNHNHSQPYQSPPRHQKYQNMRHMNHNNKSHKANQSMSGSSSSHSSASQNTHEIQTRRAPNPPPPQTDDLDKLCKFCLIAEHEPSRCVWFNPTAFNKP